MTGVYFGGAVLVALVIAAILFVRWGKKMGRADIQEADDEIRNEARDARQRLDHAERERLRKKYGQRRDV